MIKIPASPTHFPLMKLKTYFLKLHVPVSDIWRYIPVPRDCVKSCHRIFNIWFPYSHVPSHWMTNRTDIESVTSQRLINNKNENLSGSLKPLIDRAISRVTKWTPVIVFCRLNVERNPAEKCHVTSISER